MKANDLGSLVYSISYEALPAEVIEAVKLHLIDYVGIAIAGERIKTYRPVLALYHETGECTVIGTKERVSIRNAAVVNGFMAHSTWYEDGSRITGGHPASSIFPALLALAQVRNASGKQLIEATVAGYEVFNRVGVTLYPATVRRGFLPTGLLAPIAAAAACAKLMGLDADGITNAISIATPLGSGLKSAFKVADVQPIQIGRGSEAGLVAALFAEQGLKGFEGNLDAFLKAHATNDGAEVAAAKKETYEIINTYMKVHAGCRGNHAPLDATLDGMKRDGIQPDNIDKLCIVVDTVTAANEIHQPKDHLQAQFNIPFSIAIALLHGNASLLQFTDENLKDSQVREYMSRIEIQVDPELDKLLPNKRGAKAIFYLKDGRIAESFVDIPEGEPERPLTYEKLETKFNLLTRDLIGERADAILGCISCLEQIASVGELMDLLTF